MKILFSDATLLHGGAERVISILANELVNMGHEVEILLYYDRPIWYKLDERVKVFNDEQVIGNANVIKHIMHRHDFFKHSDADIILSFLAPINMVNIVATFFTDKKIIVADRNDPRKTPVNPLIRVVRNFLYRFADGIVFQSKKNMSYFSEGVKKKSCVIYNPVDVGEYRGIALKTEKKDEIVAVGRLIEQKNPLMLLEAFKIVSGRFPTYKLIYYGEGDLCEQIRECSINMNISDKVFLPGATKAVFDKIKGAKLYVMTSNYEGMPNALIEAMCVGVPVISTKVSGAVDLIKDNGNGRLVDCGDAQTLAKIITELLEEYENAEKYAQNALELNEILNCKSIVKEWMKFIDDVRNHNK